MGVNVSPLFNVRLDFRDTSLNENLEALWRGGQPKQHVPTVGVEEQVVFAQVVDYVVVAGHPSPEDACVQFGAGYTLCFYGCHSRFSGQEVYRGDSGLGYAQVERAGIDLAGRVAEDMHLNC